MDRQNRFYRDTDIVAYSCKHSTQNYLKILNRNRDFSNLPVLPQYDLRSGYMLPFGLRF